MNVLIKQLKNNVAFSCIYIQIMVLFVRWSWIIYQYDGTVQRHLNSQLLCDMGHSSELLEAFRCMFSYLQVYHNVLIVLQVEFLCGPNFLSSHVMPRCCPAMLSVVVLKKRGKDVSPLSGSDCILSWLYVNTVASILTIKLVFSSLVASYFIVS